MDYEKLLNELARKQGKIILYREFIVGGENDPSTEYNLQFGGRIFKTEDSKEATYKLAYLTFQEENDRETESKKFIGMPIREDCDINNILKILGLHKITSLTYEQFDQLEKYDYRFNRLNLFIKN